MLYGREAEQTVIDTLLAPSHGGALILRGEAGIGKSALLEYAAGQRRPVLRTLGVRAERSLPFAALHLLLRPALDQLDTLPRVQRDALARALGERAGALGERGRAWGERGGVLGERGGAPDRFLVGLAALTLLSRLGRKEPILCLIDDAHWLDAASADALLFAARRLNAEAVVMLFATRDEIPAPSVPELRQPRTPEAQGVPELRLPHSPEAQGVPELRLPHSPEAQEVPELLLSRLAGVEGVPELRLSRLSEAAAEALLRDLAQDVLVPQARRRIVEEAEGSPLALVEFAAALTPEQRAGRLGPLPFAGESRPLSARVRATFHERVLALPEPVRDMLLVAAADDSGDLDLVLRAGARLGAGQADLEHAEREEVIHLSAAGLVFHHPLLRAAAYTSAPYFRRGIAHQALAAELTPEPPAKPTPGPPAKPTPGPPAKPTPGPPAKPTPEPPAKPTTASAVGQAIAPAVGQAIALATGSARGLEAGPPAGPAAARLAGPAAGPVGEPAAGMGGEPAAGPGGEPMAGMGGGPVAGPGGEAAAGMGGGPVAGMGGGPVAGTGGGAGDGAWADRRAWHRAAAATGPDEDVAAELERVAQGERQGAAVASLAYERAAELTRDPGTAARLLAAAAELALRCGQLERAGALTARLPAGVLRARLHAGLASAHGSSGTAGRLLLDAARHDPDPGPLLAEAIGEAMWTGDQDLAREAAAELATLSPPPGSPAAVLADGMTALARLLEGGPAPDTTAVAHLLEGGSAPDTTALAHLVEGGPAPATTAVAHLVEGCAVPDVKAVRVAAASAPLPLGALVCVVSGDEAAAAELAGRHVASCRERGLLGELPRALDLLAWAHLLSGSHREAATAAGEAMRVAADLGRTHHTAVPAWLAAVEGDERRCHDLAEHLHARFVDGAPHAGIGRPNPLYGAPEGGAGGVGPLHGAPESGVRGGGSVWAETSGRPSVGADAAMAAWALGLCQLGLGRPVLALEWLRSVGAGAHWHPVVALLAAPDLVEAAVRAGRDELALEPAARFQDWAVVVERPWAVALAARVRALTARGESVGRHFGEAVAIAGGQPYQQARTQLLFGQWLRRGHRRAEARAHLRAALLAFDRLGARPWARRAHAELQATGEAAHARDGGLLDRLTPQERQVVRLAAAGLSNQQIGARLFLSPRTVGHHLYKAFPKLGVGSRAQLADLDLEC